MAPRAHPRAQTADVDVDLGKILLPDTPLLEIFIRGTLTYLALFALLRITYNRTSSSIGMTDLLVIVLIADAAQNAMAGDYTSWTDGLFLVLVIVGWAYAIDALAFRFPKTLGRWVHPPPKVLVRDGRLDRRNLERGFISEDELMSQLRVQGIDDLADVKLASMEGNGEVSIIKAGGDDAPRPPQENAAG